MITSDFSPAVIDTSVIRTSRIINVKLSAAPGIQSIQRLNATGNKFYIIDCDTDDAISIKTDVTAYEQFTVGTGKDMSAEGKSFTAIEIRNDVANDITFKLFIGYGDYIDKRTTIVGNRLSSILPVIEPKTLPLAIAATTIAGNASIVFNGVAPSIAHLRRKAMVVSNLDANLTLQILDVANNVVLTIFPSTSIIIPISEFCKIHNPNPGVLSLSASEIWWMKP